MTEDESIVPSSDNNTPFHDHVFPMEFITVASTNKLENPSDSLILNTLEYLLSLNWPVAPNPPPQIDVGTCIENFIRNVINKQQLTHPTEKLPECFVENSNKVQASSNNTANNIDYNQLIQVIQTMLNKDTPPA
ncbi:MAG: hypothetical protein E6K54_08215 [Gammaproteobacteria bacterium]|nr:MAG: hypothetical protein E6K54_08215 [Gammaproteobacteria bacterium]